MNSFADALVTTSSKGATKLEKIGAIINWNRLGYRLEKSKASRPIGGTVR
jgi:hypothetical protein